VEREVGERLLVRPLLLYNGGCRFCRWLARVLVRVDTDESLAFLSIWDEEAKPVVDAIPEHARLSGWHLVLTDGSRTSGGPGVVRLLEELRWIRWLGTSFRILGLTPWLGRLDALIARKKGRLGRKVPDGEAPHRFP
jgi:predicted DCC family thiol-disulfide oxidoreductase YuxK